MPEELSVLTWDSEDAVSLVIEPGNISVQPDSGQFTVSPDSTAAYTITATDSGGETSSAQARVFVYGDPTPGEQAHLEALSRARLSPLAEAERLGIGLFEGFLKE